MKRIHYDEVAFTMRSKSGQKFDFCPSGSTKFKAKGNVEPFVLGRLKKAGLRPAFFISNLSGFNFKKEA